MTWLLAPPAPPLRHPLPTLVWLASTPCIRTRTRTRIPQGGLTWGFVGDIIGRQRSLVAALAVNAVFGALSAASTQLWHLLTLRLIAGMGVGGSMPVVFALMSEFCPPSTR
jgi:MFS family permease